MGKYVPNDHKMYQMAIKYTNIFTNFWKKTLSHCYLTFSEKKKWWIPLYFTLTMHKLKFAWWVSNPKYSKNKVLFEALKVNVGQFRELEKRVENMHFSKRYSSTTLPFEIRIHENDTNVWLRFLCEQIWRYDDSMSRSKMSKDKMSKKILKMLNSFHPYWQPPGAGVRCYPQLLGDSLAG
jgi:hypothetical protein